MHDFDCANIKFNHAIFFLETFEAAKNYRDKFRAQQPAVYNTARLNEQQSHSVSQQSASFNDSDLNINDANDLLDAVSAAINVVNTDFNDTDTNADGIHDSNSENDYVVPAEINNEESFDADNTNNSSENVTIEATEMVVFNVNNEQLHEYQQEIDSVDNDVKDPLRDVILEENEVAAFDEMFNEENSDGNEVPENRKNSVVHVSPGGTSRITISEGDLEITYALDFEVFKPAPTGFQVKLNDILSGNIPSKDNVSSK